VGSAGRGDAGPSTFVPRLYQSRGKSGRGDALKAGGGSDLTERAVERGLAWLAHHQSPDGRWSLRDYAAHLPEPSPRDVVHLDAGGRGQRDSRGGGGTARNGDTAATGLALLCFLGHGDSHLVEGPRRDAVARGLAWLLAAEEEDGDLRGGGNLYMHGIAAFALTEAYAFTRDPRLREPAQRAISFTARSQNPRKGGWRYEPYPRSDDVDTSVFGWMLMALKSARLGGLELDERCLERAAVYLDSARMSPGGGRYSYQPGRTRTSSAMTAQGLFCQEMLAANLLSDQERADPSFRRAAEESVTYLLSNLPQAERGGVDFYYWYYATLALFQEGSDSWTTWNQALIRVLLRLQLGDATGTAAGSWDPLDSRGAAGGRVYSTTLSILCLEVYYRYARLKEK
jgi:hypothetical protein